MKKIFYFTTVMIGLLLSFTSCEDSDHSLPNEGVGYLSVEVQKGNEPAVPTTKAMEVDVNDFVIKGIPGFNGTYAELKAKGTLELTKGRYTISAQSPGVMAVASEKPFFEGEEKVDIRAGIANEVNIACTMQNVKVKLDISKILGFFDASTLKISIRKGQSTTAEESHIYTIQSDGTTDDWYFAPSNDLNLVITGTTIDGFEMGDLGIIPLVLKDAGTYQCLVVQVPGAETNSVKTSLRSSGFNIKVTTVE